MIVEIALGVMLSGRVSGFFKSVEDYLNLYSNCLKADLVVAREEIKKLARRF